MDALTSAALITAGGSLLGTGAGLAFGNRGTPASDGTFLQNQFNAQMNLSREQMAQQKEFAQHGISWRVQDAKNAGLHPLAAIGAAGASYSPTAIAGSTGEPYPGSPGSDMAQSLGAMGQSVGRAAAAAFTPVQKEMTMNELLMQTGKLEQQGLNNDLLRLQIAKATRDLTAGPPMASVVGDTGIISGQSSSGAGAGYPSSLSTGLLGGYENKPPEIPTHMPGRPAMQSGRPVPGIKWQANADGSMTALPGAQIDEFSSPGGPTYYMQNDINESWLGRLFGANDVRRQPPRELLPPGATGWSYHFGSWYPIKDTLSHLPSRNSYERMYGGSGWQRQPRR